MDPDELLRRLRRAAKDAIETEDEMQERLPDLEVVVGDLAALGQMVQDLDTWLSRGGFLPKAWKDSATATPDGELAPKKTARKKRNRAL
jgi:hypothetical protein